MIQVQLIAARYDLQSTTDNLHSTIYIELFSSIGLHSRWAIVKEKGDKQTGIKRTDRPN